MVRDEDIRLVRSSVTMRQIAQMYGMEVTRSGFARCPFHNDSRPSMKIYDGDRGFHCFVCHKGGDIIRFVRDHDGLGFEPAVRLIAGNFGIPITDPDKPLSDADRKRIAAQMERREAAERAQKANQERLKAISDKLHWLKEIQAEFEPLGALWCRCQAEIETLEQEWETRFRKEGGE